MSAALARQWDYYDDEEDLEDVDTDVEDGLDTLTLAAPSPAYEVQEGAYDFAAFPQPFRLPPPTTLNIQPFSYEPAQQPAANWQWFGEGGELLTADTEAIYALSYPETASRRDWLGEAAEHLHGLGRNRLVVGLGLALVAWLLLSNVLSWLGQSRDTEAQIYNFGASSVISPASTNTAPESKLPPPAVAPGAHAVEGQPTITVAQIETVLQKYNSPAVGKGQTIYDLGVKYGIDPAYALAFFVHESSAGTQGVAVTTKSVGNIRYTSDSGFENYQNFRKYPTWEAGIEDWYKLISGLYVKGWGLKTVETIIPKYAPTADHNSPPAYINHVNSLVEGWRNGK